MMLSWALLAVPLLIGLNAFFVAAEYAVVAIKTAQIDAIRRRGWVRAANAMACLKSDPASAIGAIQVCITMTNLLLGWIGEPAMSTAFQVLLGPLVALYPRVMATLAFGLSFILVTYLTVVFSELLPKAMTLRAVESAATLTAVPMLVIRRAIAPLVWLMNRTADLITVPLGLGHVADVEEERISADEIQLLTTRAGEQGVLRARERSLILNSLAMGRRTAREIMIARTCVAYLDLQRSMEENRQVMNEYLHSRMPLCNGNLDNVVGVVHTKEFLSAYYAEADISVLSLIASEPVFAPETIALDQLVGVFHDRRTQFVLLVDEHGGVEGIVTLQDVVDELVGEISEAAAHADGEEPPAATRLMVPGNMALHDLARQLGRTEWKAPHRVTTVGGAITAELGRIPVAGEEVVIDGVHLRVAECDGKAVHRVQVLGQ